MAPRIAPQAATDLDDIWYYVAIETGLSPKGSPSAANLTKILTALQKMEGVHFELALKQ